MQKRMFIHRRGRTWAGTVAFLALTTAILGSHESKPAADEMRVALLEPPHALASAATPVGEADLPAILSAADVERYRRIFALQESGAWAAADREIAKLDDKILLGHVLAQRYLSKKSHASYDDLAAWMDRYADQPDAKAIHALALNRHPKGAPAPAPPATAVPRRLPDEIASGPRPIVTPAGKPAVKLSPRALHLAGQIREATASDPHRAESMLAGADAKRLLDDPTREALRVNIADAYLAAGQVQEALQMSAAAHSARYAPIAHWQAGLAAWRLDRLDEAKAHFEALAQSPGQTGWTKSAAAFWAARVAMRQHKPQQVAYWLGIAAERARTFYGLLARRILGVDTYLNFDADPFTAFDAQIVTGIDAGRRALALVAVGERQRAEAELRALAQRASPTVLQSLAAAADRANLPGLSLQLAGALALTDGRNHDQSLYPVPRWTPHGGFTVDRALLFALMRQESLFAPHVASNAGALGLMQLMPATARSMAQRTGVDVEECSPRGLADPELNLTLAQEYVQTLLAGSNIKGNLLLFAVAYNWGPTVAQRWEAKWPALLQDPLLFLESIPAPEARTFTLRVLTNYWIYRQRLGQPVPDLDALAGGQWPTYTALDSESGRHAENR
jgi:soluble lytic murein transglycosylase